MGCKYSMDEINNYYDGNISHESSNAIEEHIKSCEDCRVYYSSLVITGKLINRNESSTVNMYHRLEGIIDKERYMGRKKMLYRLSGLFSSHGQILKPAVIAVLICIISVYAMRYGKQISNYLDIGIQNITTENQNGLSEDQVKEIINKTGGISSKLEVQNENGNKLSKEELLQTKKIIGKRLNNLGLTEHIIDIDYGNSCLYMAAAWANNLKDKNFENTLKELVKKGSFSLQEVDENLKDSNGHYLSTGKIIISNMDIVEAHSGKNVNLDGDTISLTLNEEGTVKFSEATGRLIGMDIAIFMDDTLLMAPHVIDQITNGQVTLSGIEGIKKVDIILAQLKSDALSVKVEVSDFKIIEPNPMLSLD